MSLLLLAFSCFYIPSTTVLCGYDTTLTADVKQAMCRVLWGSNWIRGDGWGITVQVGIAPTPWHKRQREAVRAAPR